MTKVHILINNDHHNNKMSNEYLLSIVILEAPWG